MEGVEEADEERDRETWKVVGFPGSRNAGAKGWGLPTDPHPPHRRS